MALDHVSAENVTVDRTVIGTELACDVVTLLDSFRFNDFLVLYPDGMQH